jgi:transposase
MSLPFEAPNAIPQDTVRVARAAFPKGSLAMHLRDHLGTLYDNPLFTELFSPLGAPAIAPWRLTLVLVLQFAEGLSDRQAADAVRGRIDWKYALGLELTDEGFHFAVLSEFRERLINGGLEQQLLDTLLAHCQEQGWIKAGGKQRTDATHVLGAIRAMNRLESIGETMRAALNALAVAAPDWLLQHVGPEWFDRYGDRVEEYRLPKGKAARQEYASRIGADGSTLLTAIYGPTAPQAPEWLRQIPAVEVLRRVWVQQFHVPDAQGVIRLREGNDLPPSNLWIHSPYDEEVRYGTKRSTNWAGYKVHLTETCDPDPDSVHLITQVQTTMATEGDVTQVREIQTELKAKNLAPKTHLVDAGYTSGEEFVTSRRERGIELLGPVREDNQWQAQAKEGYGLASFKIDWEHKSVLCPQGKPSRYWKPGQDICGRATVKAVFHTSDCESCAVRSLCTRSEKGPRSITFRERAEHEALQEVRQLQHTSEFKAAIDVRAGVEGTMSQGVRAFELRRTRYIGLARTHLQHILTAVAMNIVRLVAWWRGAKQARTRVSHFAALAPALAVA